MAYCLPGATSTERLDGLADMAGDSGAGGVRGLVPAPAAGDAAAGKFLKANGSWAAPTAGSGDVTAASTIADNRLIRGDGGSKGVQQSGITVDDSDNMTGVAALGASSIELGHASDTTLARSSAGNVSIEGNVVYRAGGTDVPITDGGTGASTAAAARTNLGLWTTVFKTADESITNDNTLSDDADLYFAMAANTTYAYRIRLFYETGITGDFKFEVTAPASPTAGKFQRLSVAPGATSFGNVQSSYDVPGSTSVLGSGGGGHAFVDGIFQNGANAGNLQVRWAQNTSDGTATVLRKGSWIEWCVVP